MHTHVRVRGLAGVALLALAACNGGASTGRPTEPTSAALADPAGCPLGVSGARATAESTADGVALVFTSKYRADELRVRAHDAAMQHGPGAHEGQGHWGLHGQVGNHGLHAMHLPKMRAVAENIDGGARLVLTPLDQLDLDRLRQSVADGIAQMNARCT